MPDDLNALAGALADDTRRIEQNIQAVRDAVRMLNQNVSSVRQEQQKYSSQINNIQGQISQLAQGQFQLREQLQSTKKDLESRLEELNARLASQESQIVQIATFQKEQAAKENLQRRRAKFVLDVKALFETIDDGAVRYLFAGYALEVLPKQGITEDAFSTLSDMNLFGNFLKMLQEARNGAKIEDQHEALKFVELIRVEGELASRQRGFVSINAGITEKLRILEQSQVELLNRISELEIPETPSEAAKRRNLFRLLLASGVVLIGVALFCAAAAAQLSTNVVGVLGVLFLLLGVGLLVASWFQTYQHRINSLESAKERRQRVANQLGELHNRLGAEHVRLQEQILGWRTRLNGIGGSILAPDVDLVKAIVDLLKVAGEMRTAWVKIHPQISTFRLT